MLREYSHGCNLSPSQRVDPHSRSDSLMLELKLPRLDKDRFLTAIHSASHITARLGQNIEIVFFLRHLASPLTAARHYTTCG